MCSMVRAVWGRKGSTQDGQVGRQQAEMDAVVDTFVVLRRIHSRWEKLFPGLFFLHVFIALAGKINHFIQRFPEFVGFQGLRFFSEPRRFRPSAHGRYHRPGLHAIWGTFASAEFVHQHPGAVHKIPKDRSQLAVHRILKPFHVNSLSLVSGRSGSGNTAACLHTDHRRFPVSQNR